jgi:hypothetical protein
LLLAESVCTRDWIINQRKPHPNITFDAMLAEAIENKDIDAFKGALMYGLGYACEISAILSNGIDIVNHETYMWTAPDLKTVLETQEIPIGLKSDPLIRKRYPSCHAFFQNPAIREILVNSAHVMYNRMRKLNAQQSAGYKLTKRRTKQGKKTRRNTHYKGV